MLRGESSKSSKSSTPIAPFPTGLVWLGVWQARLNSGGDLGPDRAQEVHLEESPDFLAAAGEKGGVAISCFLDFSLAVSENVSLARSIDRPGLNVARHSRRKYNGT